MIEQLVSVIIIMVYLFWQQKAGLIQSWINIMNDINKEVLPHRK